VVPQFMLCVDPPYSVKRLDYRARLTEYSPRRYQMRTAGISGRAPHHPYSANFYHA
jgi:hypothetical protein